jgi:hypothetical protein
MGNKMNSVKMNTDRSSETVQSKDKTSAYRRKKNLSNKNSKFVKYAFQKEFKIKIFREKNAENLQKNSSRNHQQICLSKIANEVFSG